MSDRVNLCKVSPELKGRLNDVKGDDNWPDFMDTVAEVFEQGVIVKTERMGGHVSKTRLQPGEKHETVGETLAVSVSYAEDKYECDRCGDEFPLSQVLIFDDGDRVVHSGCLDVKDRIIE